jgi:beta-lactamase superfamily II metal-dependent hydrolase
MAKALQPRRVDEILPEHLQKGLLNIVVFGPGRGEAIVVVLPDGQLGVVDGCREPEDHDSGRGDPVRELLAHISHHRDDRQMRLRFVCLTHPHDDHYGGLGRLLYAYQGRVDEVWSPVEVGDRYAQAYRKWLELSQEPSVVQDREILRGLDRVLAAMRSQDAHGHPRPRHLDQDKLLVRPTKMYGAELSIWGVAPSATDLRLGLDALIERLRALEQPNPPSNSSSSFDPNDASGALLLCWGKTRVLLAGDLTQGAHPHRGWQSARASIQGPVQIVNVAHHASEGAHDGELWTEMRPRLAIVTPFKNAKDNQPPKPGDIKRLLASNARVVITTRPKWNWEETADTLPIPDPAGNVLRSSSPARRRGAPKNDILGATDAPSFDDRRNAVATAIDRHGAIRSLVLAGQANLYHPVGTKL